MLCGHWRDTFSTPPSILLSLITLPTSSFIHPPLLTAVIHALFAPFLSLLLSLSTVTTPLLTPSLGLVLRLAWRLPETPVKASGKRLHAAWLRAKRFSSPSVQNSHRSIRNSPRIRATANVHSVALSNASLRLRLFCFSSPSSLHPPLFFYAHSCLAIRSSLHPFIPFLMSGTGSCELPLPPLYLHWPRTSSYGCPALLYILYNSRPFIPLILFFFVLSFHLNHSIFLM
ncbi:hypothetical protein GJAV_G00102180 [Gymnothorax javanicus]|nr:hypothetical protein GJAV_G00102180 [Gymnothorax javanicus]